MKKDLWVGIILSALVGAFLVSPQGVYAHGDDESPGHVEAEEGQQTLTGEVVDAFCYLSHGDKGLGKDHAKCGRKCIENGLPVAIRSGGQLYLAAMSDHTPANAVLAEYAGQQVTVMGTIREADGQKMISIDEIESVN